MAGPAPGASQPHAPAAGLSRPGAEAGGEIELGRLRASLLDAATHALEESEPTGPGDDLAARLAAALHAREVKLPALPASVLHIRRIASAPEIDLGALATAVESDPAITAKLVGIANSVLCRGLEPIRSVPEAVVRLGARQTWSVALAVTLRTRTLSTPGFERLADEFWSHSLFAASALQEIAPLVSLDPSEGFLLGLVHDLGRLVVYGYAGGTDPGPRARPSPEAIARVADAVHPALGALALESWGFESSVVSAVQRHHYSRSAASPAALRALALADSVSRLILAAKEGAETDLSSLEPELEALGLDPSQAGDLAARACAAFEERSLRI